MRTITLGYWFGDLRECFGVDPAWIRERGRRA
jgi:hypothetical protein